MSSDYLIGFASLTLREAKAPPRDARFEALPQRSEKQLIADVRRVPLEIVYAREFERRDSIAILGDRQESVDDREPALFELCDAQDERLAKIIAERLDDPLEDHHFKAVCVVASERLHVRGDTDRRLLRAALGRYWLRALPSDGPIVWAAIRRFGSLLDDGQALGLAYALRASNPTGVQQVAIQSLTAFFTRPDLAEQNTEGLTVLLSLVARNALRRTRELTGEVRAEWLALGCSVVVLFAAMGVEAGEPIAREIAALVGPVVRRQVHEDLERVAAAHRLHLALSAHARVALAGAEALERVFEA